MEAGEDCEQFFQLHFRNEGWKDVVSLTEFQGGVEVHQTIKGRLELFD